MTAEKTTSNRIIHVPRRFVADEWGGTETVILEISKVQKQNGWQPEIWTSLALSDRREDEIGHIPVRRFPYRYPFFGLSKKDRHLMDKKGGNLMSPQILWSMARAKEVRLFHAHALKRLGGEVFTAARWQKKPFVVSLHGGVFDVPKLELNQMLQPIKGKLEWGKFYGALVRSRKILNEADYVICVGKSEMDAAKKSIPHDRVDYLPNGVDTHKFEKGDGRRFRSKHNIDQNAFMVLAVSRIDIQKNQKTLVEAIARLRPRHPDAHLVLIGPPTQPDYASSIEEVIRKEALNACVTWIPGLPNDHPDLVDAFHASDVFVLPSLHEPFGIVILEAWSAGKPVVASHVGGLKTLITDRIDGLFFDPNSNDAPDALADRVEELIINRDLGMKLGERGLANVKAHYQWDRINEKLESIYALAEKHHRDR
jgi:glycosyltransferase involved in cell wall biosynthesis